MALTQTQVLKQTQRIEQRQLMLTRLLDVSDLELEELLKREAEENPVLEIVRDDAPESAPDVFTEEKTPSDEQTMDDHADDWESGDYERIMFSSQETHPKRVVAATVSFREELLQQIGELNLTDLQRRIAEYIVGYLEDDGYLRHECLSISNDLITQYGLRVSAADVEKVLVDVVQTLEPSGVGARNLQECLLLQLHTLQTQEPSPFVEMAAKVVQNDFDDFIHKKFDRICKKENIQPDAWIQVQNIIKKLDPNPGHGAEFSDYILPDFIVTIENDELKLSLANESRLKLRVNQDYDKTLSELRARRNKEALQFIQKNIEKARLLVETLPERDRTMYLVMNEIMQFQHDFFMTGDFKLLRPMVLRDIAVPVGMDVSTVSRVTARRYVQTPYGTFLLKKLFSEATNEEDGVSSNAVKQCVKELIDNEDKNHPLTDEKIVEQLLKKGFRISRRTVAKYRDQLGISSTSIRRQH